MAKNKGKNTTIQHPNNTPREITAADPVNMKEKGVVFPNKQPQQLLLHETEGVPVDWEELGPGDDPHTTINEQQHGGNEQEICHAHGDYPAAGAAILKLLNQPPNAAKNATNEQQPPTYQQVLAAASAPENNTPSILRAPLSLDRDKEMVEQLSKLHPMRNEAHMESNADYLDTEQSVNMQERPTAHTSPWIINEGESLQKVQPLKADLILPHPSISYNNNVLLLDESDYIPVAKGWGFSLLGFFIGRFPGKEAVKHLTARWKFIPLISYHPKGWIVFRFQKKEEAELILSSGPYTIFGIHMVLGHLPPEFRFDSSPQLQFKVWAKLPNLPLELWNPSAIAKIATVVGSPLEVDYSTASKNYIDGPRVLILVDATQQPPENVTIALHNGNSFTQNILLENYPFFCTNCRRAGHRVSSCRAIPPTNNGMRNHPRHHTNNVAGNGADADGWQQVQNRKNRAGRSRSRRGGNRSLSKAPISAPPRSVSRPHNQQWVPKNSNVAAAATTNRAGYGIPKIINNTHTVFESTSPSHNAAPERHERIEISNQFHPFDDLEQPDDIRNYQSPPKVAAPIIADRSSPDSAEPGFSENQRNEHTKSSTPATNEHIPVHPNMTEVAESSGSAQPAADNKSSRNQEHFNGNKKALQQGISPHSASTEYVLVDAYPTRKKRSASADCRLPNAYNEGDSMSFANFIREISDVKEKAQHPPQLNPPQMAKNKDKEHSKKTQEKKIPHPNQKGRVQDKNNPPRLK